MSRRQLVRRARRRLALRRGFSMVELIVAMSLFTVAALGSAGLLASTSRRARMYSARTEMTTLGEAKLEELRGYGMTVASNPLRARVALGGSLNASVAGYADTVVSPRGRTYVRSWLLTTAIAGGPRATVRVTPHSSTSFYDTRRVDLTTLLTLQ